ncbi:hypothetical protein RRG08_059015 [Elysia crispata]|uniref:Uncharacterized protein n=1 Tax=Elysia crispata TaxID=231223 RepID=A0AAE0ZC56_9GAST|nr:hypothetical protein RRG08_059015 [Elysia crispata]
MLFCFMVHSSRTPPCTHTLTVNLLGRLAPAQQNYGDPLGYSEDYLYRKRNKHLYSLVLPKRWPFSDAGKIKLPEYRNQCMRSVPLPILCPQKAYSWKTLTIHCNFLGPRIVQWTLTKQGQSLPPVQSQIKNLSTGIYRGREYPGCVCYPHVVNLSVYVPHEEPKEEMILASCKISIPGFSKTLQYVLNKDIEPQPPVIRFEEGRKSEKSSLGELPLVLVCLESYRGVEVTGEWKLKREGKLLGRGSYRVGEVTGEGKLQGRGSYRGGEVTGEGKLQRERA